MEDQFNVTYEIDDGYVGGHRPQHFPIYASDLEDDMSDKDLSNLFNELMEDDMASRVSAYSKMEDDFIAWAKEQISKRGDDS